MIDWNIQPRACACQSCSRPFRDGQPYHTLLFDDRVRYRRQDVCEGCWQTQFSLATDRRGFVSYWQGVYQAPPPKAPEPIQRETAETLLRKLMAQNDPRHLATTYILAVMLERKRLLKVKDQLVSHGQRTFIYEHTRTGEMFSIPDPGLRLDQLDQVQRDVAALLAQANPAAGPPSAPADSAASPAGPASDSARDPVSSVPPGQPTAAAPAAVPTPPTAP